MEQIDFKSFCTFLSSLLVKRIFDVNKKSINWLKMTDKIYKVFGGIHFKYALEKETPFGTLD